MERDTERDTEWDKKRVREGEGETGKKIVGERERETEKKLAVLISLLFRWESGWQTSPPKKVCFYKTPTPMSLCVRWPGFYKKWLTHTDTVIDYHSGLYGASNSCIRKPIKEGNDGIVPKARPLLSKIKFLSAVTRGHMLIMCMTWLRLNGSLVRYWLWKCNF